MNTFTAAFFFLPSQVASAEFGVDAEDLKRRHLQDASSKFATLDMTVRRVKGVKSKSKKSTKGKNKSQVFDYQDIGDMYSMSFSMLFSPTSSKTSSADSMRSKFKGAEKSKGSAKSKKIKPKGDVKQNQKEPTKSEDGTNEKGSHSAKHQSPKSKGAEQSKAPTNSKEGKSKGAEKKNGPEQSKENAKEKGGHSAKSQPLKSKGAGRQNRSNKSKEGTKDSSGERQESQISIDFTKFTRSSLKSAEASTEQATEQVPDTAQSLRNANPENTAFAYGVNSVFLVTVSSVTVGSLVVA